jgi:hypothetical protein
VVVVVVVVGFTYTVEGGIVVGGVSPSKMQDANECPSMSIYDFDGTVGHDVQTWAVVRLFRFSMKKSKSQLTLA